MSYIRVHSNIPGPLTEGNALANKFTKLIALSQVELAQQSHVLNHQNSKSLKKQFGLTREISHQIVKHSIYLYLIWE